MLTVTIVYPTDPLGVVPGGTDTCIRDILRFAPNDIEIRLVGVTTDSVNRPLNQWTECEVSGMGFWFFPVLDVTDLKKQMRIPLSVQFTLRLAGKDIFKDTDVIQFHRIEPALAALSMEQPKLLIIHQNMNVIHSRKSDIRWKYFPAAYFWVENFIIKRMKEIFIVREDAVAEYQARFSEQNEHIHFLPTWMNPNLFFREEAETRARNKAEILEKLGVDPLEEMMVFVGRFDHQKDPLLLIDSVARVFQKRKTGQLMLIGDGVLRNDVEARIRSYNIENRVHLLGAMPQEDVARHVRVSDLLLLTSVYEGMPRCVVEALGCGVPIVTTNAGEVTLLVHNDENGYIVSRRDPDEFANAVNTALNQLDMLSNLPCLKAVHNYRAGTVLEKLYDTYRLYARYEQ